MISPLAHSKPAVYGSTLSGTAVSTHLPVSPQDREAEALGVDAGIASSAVDGARPQDGAPSGASGRHAKGDPREGGSGRDGGGARSGSGFGRGSDRVELSGRGKAAPSKSDPPAEAGRESEAESVDDPMAPKSSTGEPLTENEQETVEQLKARDQEVRTHEQAHVVAGGQYVSGGPTYSYQQGPDGKRYAIGGEVQIDTSPIPDDPEATIQKMQQVKRAALAPAEPSTQDRKVAAQAQRAMQTAQAEYAKSQQGDGAGQSESSFQTVG